jgi:hypothetical protein
LILLAFVFLEYQNKPNSLNIPVNKTLFTFFTGFFQNARVQRHLRKSQKNLLHRIYSKVLENKVSEEIKNLEIKLNSVAP